MVKKSTLILRSLGLSDSDRRLPVKKLEDKLFKDGSDRLWVLTYLEGAVQLQEASSGEQKKATHLSDLVVFYSEHEFDLYLKKISEDELS